MIGRWAHQKQTGFTIVELLIVIVVIGILAAITIVAYNGVQSRARNTARESGLETIRKALELYYTDNGQYPTSQSCGSTVINGNWCTTADSSWDTFATRLKSGNNFIASVPRDPVSTPGQSPLTGAGYNYAYFSYPDARCGSVAGQWYYLLYLREGEQTGESCTDLPVYPSASKYLVLH